MSRVGLQRQIRISVYPGSINKKMDCFCLKQMLHAHSISQYENSHVGFFGQQVGSIKEAMKMQYAACIRLSWQPSCCRSCRGMAGELYIAAIFWMWFVQLLRRLWTFFPLRSTRWTYTDLGSILVLWLYFPHKLCGAVEWSIVMIAFVYVIMGMSKTGLPNKGQEDVLLFWGWLS